MLQVFTADARRLDAALAGLKETVGSVTPPEPMASPVSYRNAATI
jgi:hypothetical protein